MYSPYVSFVLGGMVVTGAARSIVAKLFYQLGFEHPLFLTLLYLFGQALSLVPYNIWIALGCKVSLDKDENVGTTEHINETTPSTVQVDSPSASISRSELMKPNTKRASVRFSQALFTCEDDKEGPESPIKSNRQATDEGPDVENLESSAEQAAVAQPKTSSTKTKKASMSKSVSVHGLPEQSRTQHIVERIPWYLKPAVPAFFNLLNSAMRWMSLVFVAASVAEMLISGTELVLSVLATRCVRGRKVTRVRWVGIMVCTVGIIMVGVFDYMHAAKGSDSTTEVETSSRDQVIGILLILGQSIMSVFQDLSEELFMQEAAFPPALLVGMEGGYGLIIALILYFPIAPLMGESLGDLGKSLSSGKILGLSLGWALLVTVTGVFNIAATGVTSSMTRNVWKNLRTTMIWIVSLVIFYASGNPSLGEEWVIPYSFYILLGFSVILAGIYLYYGKGSKA